MKTIGFRACWKDVPFRKHGKLDIKAPDEPDVYQGYWWDKTGQNQKQENSDPDNDEYYYYLNPKWHDT